MKLDYAKAIAEYFRSNQWQRFTELLQTLGQKSHIHVFVNTSLHPLSLERIIKGYLAMRGWSVNRGNEILRWSAPKTGSLHGVHPHDMPHFDLIWRFRKEIPLEPMEEKLGEQGKNLLYWDDSYMRSFYRGYVWRAVGREEDAAIREYFRSEHWQNAFGLILDPEIAHVHVNVETCVHPHVLERYFVRAIEARRWRVFRTVPNVVLSNGTYYGKIMFLLSEPELSFDFSWFFNSEKILAPCSHQLLAYGNPEYLIVRKSEVDELVGADDYVMLEDDDLQQCMMSIEL